MVACPRVLKRASLRQLRANLSSSPPQIRSHDFRRFINLYVCTYVLNADVD